MWRTALHDRESHLFIFFRWSKKLDIGSTTAIALGMGTGMGMLCIPTFSPFDRSAQCARTLACA
jgi:hypothetical protein